jgi:hypothetical protein
MQFKARLLLEWASGSTDLLFIPGITLRGFFSEGISMLNSDTFA